MPSYDGASYDGASYGASYDGASYDGASRYRSGIAVLGRGGFDRFPIELAS